MLLFLLTTECKHIVNKVNKASLRIIKTLTFFPGGNFFQEFDIEFPCQVVFAQTFLQISTGLNV